MKVDEKKYRELVEKVRKIKAEYSLNNHELATRVGVGMVTISRAMNGSAPIPKFSTVTLFELFVEKFESLKSNRARREWLTS